MTTLDALAAMEHEDPEYVPEILPVDARLSIRGKVSTLQKLFSRAASVTPSKEVVPGTMYALLESFHASSQEVSHVRITASDGDQTVSVVVDGLMVLMAGAVLVPAKRIQDILKLAPSDTAKIEVIGTAAIIRSGRAQWTVQTPVGDSLGTLLDVSGIEMQAVEVGPFVNAMSVARRAASSTSAWSGLNQLLIRDGTITGCDGALLHKVTLGTLDASVDLTIPVRAVDELLRALRASSSEFFEMGFDERHLVCNIDQDSIIAKRLLVPFPNIENLLLGPAFSNTYSLTVDRAELSAVIARMRVNSDPDTYAVYLNIMPNKKDSSGALSWSLAIRVKDRSGNAAQEIIECQWVGPAKAQTLTVNHRYLSEFLAGYDSETVIFKIGENTKTQPSPLFIEDTVLGFTGIVQQMLANW